MTEDTLYLIALSSIQDLGPLTIKRLLSYFKSPRAVFKAGLKDLTKVEGVGEKRANAIKNFSGLDEIEKGLKGLTANDIKVLTYYSEDYPEMLENIADAPLVIYIKGEVKKEDKFAIAIVGSRKPTSYGVSTAESMAEELSSMGFTIVSGLARGIDTSAHIGAVRCGGRSIAVLGSGIDVAYPSENKGLMERIAKSGFILSEFPLGTVPNRENFPRRNRLISGLSLGVLVVEAGHDSGALITARHALEQGKEVFSIPGNINSPLSRGTNELIKAGARVVISAKDILEELAGSLKGFIKSCKEDVKIDISEEERMLCKALSGEPMHVDNISRQIEMPVGKALSILLSLELKGVVRQADGKRFYLA